MSYGGASDIGAALSNLITTIIEAFVALFSGFAQWLQQNAGTIANIIGYTMLATGVVGVIAFFGRRIYDFVRGYLRF